MRGSAVGIMRSVVQGIYPDATESELDRGASFLFRASTGTRADEYMANMTETTRKLEQAMFGEGDHSGKRSPEFKDGLTRLR